jgi:hypothetical protein
LLRFLGVPTGLNPLLSHQSDRGGQHALTDFKIGVDGADQHRDAQGAKRQEQ